MYRQNLLLQQLTILLLSLFLSANVFAESADDEPDDQATTKAESGQDKDATAKPAVAGGSTDAGKHGAGLVGDPNDPSTILTQLGFFGWTESSSDNKNIANTFLFQPVLPLTGSNVMRPALPFTTTGGPNGKSGIGDLFVLDLEINSTSWGSWGWGGVASIPIASDDTLGSDKWEAGPAGLYINSGAFAHQNIFFGILFYNQWSFAGKSDRPDVNIFSFEPIFNIKTKWGYISWTDIMATVDWKNDNALSLPVGLSFGKVIPGKTPINVYITPYYTFNNKGRDDVWGIKLQASFIKPTWLQH